MSERHCDLYLTDIIESGRAIQSYVRGVDLRIVWNAIHQDLPLLLAATTSILAAGSEDRECEARG